MRPGSFLCRLPNTLSVTPPPRPPGSLVMQMYVCVCTCERNGRLDQEQRKEQEVQTKPATNVLSTPDPPPPAKLELAPPCDSSHTLAQKSVTDSEGKSTDVGKLARFQPRASTSTPADLGCDLLTPIFLVEFSLVVLVFIGTQI